MRSITITDMDTEIGKDEKGSAKAEKSSLLSLSAFGKRKENQMTKDSVVIENEKYLSSSVPDNKKKKSNVSNYEKETTSANPHISFSEPINPGGGTKNRK
jgi:hypothetical protein